MKPISSEELLTGCLNGFNATMPEMKPSNVIWKKRKVDFLRLQQQIHKARV